MPKAKAKVKMKKKRISRTKAEHARAMRRADIKRINDSSVFPSGWEVNQTCPLCGREGTVQEQGYDDPIDGISVKQWHDTIDQIMIEHPEWRPEDGSCRRCLVFYGMERAGRAGEGT